MSMTLPSPVAAYFAGQNAQDVDAVADWFTDDAVIHDENRDHRGIAAIRTWKEETTRKYRPTIDPIDNREAAGRIIVTARVSGDFSGSPIELDFAFTLEGEKIAALDIG